MQAPSGFIYKVCEVMVWVMRDAPRAVAFFDGQNLYRHAMAAFGHHHPNYDPVKLTDFCCRQLGWKNASVRFYAGMPSETEDPFWHKYWSRRTLSMRRASINVVTRPLRYRDTRDTNPRRIAVEKGIDMRIGLDIMRLVWRGEADIILLFSQDQDMSEFNREVKEVNRLNNTDIQIWPAFPAGPKASSLRGVAGAKWFRINEQDYNRCLDARDYRPKQR